MNLVLHKPCQRQRRLDKIDATRSGPMRNFQLSLKSELLRDRELRQGFVTVSIPIHSCRSKERCA
jgi:hypothetical protein